MDLEKLLATVPDIGDKAAREMTIARNHFDAARAHAVVAVPRTGSVYTSRLTFEITIFSCSVRSGDWLGGWQKNRKSR